MQFPDGKLISKTVEVRGDHYRPAPTARIAPADCAVIVPVYNAAEDVAICLERLRAYTPPEVDILFVDDASPDPQIARLLSRLEISRICAYYAITTIWASPAL
ncbi:glycosyltransferase [Paracoccus cavernae]|uniref:Glycosyltransferase n=1 Tax=Paracoccus cavernae TaxID=1571207 RepID=A0ABT8DCA1_9RHOB|nr:glycosyltransferase [Paracoccus cavernae]